MKAVMVMFDSLNRRYLPPYANTWVHAPNFARLGRRCTTFDTSYVCSMPCMPARRDLHTGRPNFLHREWGPLEPFDDSMPAMLTQAGIYTHIASDHYHYWEDGGCTYHNRYNTWEFFRGQEGDPWVPMVGPVPMPRERAGRNAGTDRYPRQDFANRTRTGTPADLPMARTFAAGLDFLETNHREDNWFLQIETFDPHEPFFSNPLFNDLYAHHYDSYRGPLFDWPTYTAVSEPPELVEHIRYEYASLVSACDAQLGTILNAFDRHNLWDDTMLVVWTDHGFLLGERDMWAKIWMPFYEELARTPFFVWDPRFPNQDARRSALVQPSIDLPVTLLNYFGQKPTERMVGQDLAPVLAEDRPVRDVALFGTFGRQLNITDGRHVLMQACDPETPLYNYTLMPTHMREPFSHEELAGATMAPPLQFTQGCPVLKIPARKPWKASPEASKDLLWDLQADPAQTTPVHAPAIAEALIQKALPLLDQLETPPEQRTARRIP